jgi:formylglycine-generating enzyme required for sulfatase activity
MKKPSSLVRSTPPGPRSPARQASRWRWLALLGLVLIGAAGGFGLYYLIGGDPTRPPGPAPEGMVWVPGGWFWMGSDEPMGMDKEPNSAPVHRVFVDGFWMDATEVTNAQFRTFVEATGYRTVAERMPDREILDNALPEYRHIKGPFSLVFCPPESCPPGQECNCNLWWKPVAGADWKHPGGPGTSIEGKDNYPVVHICYADALAYAEWAGKRLPTEAEWERAARGGLDRKRYYWGDELRPGGKWMANTWQGKFPCENTAADGHAGLAPVASYPPNAYGLYDMAGNAWEWTSDYYRPSFEVKDGEELRNPTGPAPDPRITTDLMRVLRGGSYLCADVYCARYRAGGRQPGDVSTGQSHTGFRCVLKPGE